MLFILTLAAVVVASICTGIHIAEGDAAWATVWSALAAFNTFSIYVQYTVATK